MTKEGQKAVTSSISKVLRSLGLTGLYTRFGPEVRHGNQPDMPIITTNKVWFLRENRFLVFTRGGPVEVTLKPSLVLTGILICMAGVAAIFYSTIIASYSAIEVMREETIKTAQASSNPKDSAAFRKDNSAASALKWFDYSPTNLEDSHPPAIVGKIAQSPSVIVGRITTQPAVTTPQAPQISPDTKISENDAMPMIIQGGKRITLASNAETAKPQFGDSVNNIARKPRVNDSSSPMNMPILAPAVAPKQDNAGLIDAEQSLADQNMIIKNYAEPASIAAHAQEFAIALLPNFASAPKVRKTDKIQSDANNSDAIVSERPSPPLPKLPEQSAATTVALPAAPDITQADGLLTGFFAQRQGPALPLVTEAARTKKMLLALEQEIDYIRATVSGLGVSAGALPSQIQLAAIAKGDDFKNMMVSLAEHRAALRKIPFKPPMLYFYISSHYGNRKHPKTGKVSFHHGVDLAGTWQENVRATAPGTVIYAGTEGSFGKVVRVQHDFGIVTTYAHLARITVRLDDYIGENHVIGKMGNTGRSAGAHLHYEVRVNNKSIDPVKFMTVGRQISVAGELRQSNLVE
ncbi:peptidoglycan DD-metalloendopeptidase family protein [Alphaproteobacteria bacterium]|nr:peptidoglycan DD-metalloendopeptidase family protein [Alphaproteobacteria bacterium]